MSKGNCKQFADNNEILTTDNNKRLCRICLVWIDESKLLNENQIIFVRQSVYWRESQSNNEENKNISTHLIFSNLFQSRMEIDGPY